MHTVLLSFLCGAIGRLRISVSTINPIYEFSVLTRVRPFRSYGTYSYGSCTHGPWVCTYREPCFRKFVLMVHSCKKQSNVRHTCGRVSRRSLRTLGTVHCSYGLSNTAAIILNGLFFIHSYYSNCFCGIRTILCLPKFTVTYPWMIWMQLGHNTMRTVCIHHVI